MLDAFKEERMYGIEICETDQMYESYAARNMPMFTKLGLWNLSTF